jgi:lipopolysaccharide export system protein LptA
LNKTKGFWNYYVTQTGSGNVVIATGKMLLEADNLTNEGVSRYEGYNGNFKTYTI